MVVSPQIDIVYLGKWDRGALSYAVMTPTTKAVFNLNLRGRGTRIKEEKEYWENDSSIKI